MSGSNLETYQDAKEWLYGLKNRGSTYGIERMEVLARRMGDPQRSYPVIHIAGTNGKGSTAALLEALFRAHGFKTGLSTSPHIVRQGERIQINRTILSEERILDYTRSLKQLAESIASENAELHPSFFEFMTGMAFEHFRKEGVDIAIVEVGLGGRLDASNIVDPELSVITSIGLDHCEILGDTIEKIAREKAGIIKPGRPVVIGNLPAEAETVIEEICQAKGCDCYRLKDYFGEGQREFPRCSLAGGYQRVNAALALLAARILQPRFGLDLSRCEASLMDVSWPGRWEERQLLHRRIIFDVSHNAEGAYWLEENLKGLAEQGEARPDVIMGVMGAYRAQAIVPVVSKFADTITFVIPQQSRAATFEELEACVPSDFEGTLRRGNVAELFPAKGLCSLDEPKPGPIIVTGSIYLIGEIWERFLEDEPVGQGMLQDF